MPSYQIAPGNKEVSLSEVTTAVSGTSYFVHKTNPDGRVGWTYEPGTNKPTALALVLETSPDKTAWTIVDTIIDPSKQQVRSIVIGRGVWVRARVLSITIGGGDPLSSYIFI